MIIAADSLYDDEHPELVTRMIRQYLNPSSTARVLVAVPLRDKHTVQLAAIFKNLLQDCDLKILHEGWEDCRDDWESVDGEGVECWWALLSWNEV